jgi:recombination protein RecA
MATKTPAQRVLDALNNKLPSTAKARMAAKGSSAEINQVIPTGIEALDHHVLGTGGLVAGRVYEIFSEEGAGKSSLNFQFLGAAQRAGGVGVLVVTERDLLVKRAEVFGCDLDSLILKEPATLEQTLNGIRDLLKVIPKGVGPNVIGWDSLASTAVIGQREWDFGKDKGIGAVARLLSDSMKVLVGLALETQSAVVVINQLRSKIGVLFGNPEVTPGGRAVKHHASVRLQLWKGGQYPEGSFLPKGTYATIKAVKNKLAPPLRKAKFRLNFEGGWENEWSLINLGKDLNVLADKAQVSKKNLALVREHLGVSVDDNV